VILISYDRNEKSPDLGAFLLGAEMLTIGIHDAILGIRR
jgi:hypothetical protein